MRHNVASDIRRLSLVCKGLRKVTLHLEKVILMCLKCDLDYTKVPNYITKTVLARRRRPLLHILS